MNWDVMMKELTSNSPNSLRRIVLKLFALFSMLPRAIEAGWFDHSKDNKLTIPPSRFLKWDISRKDSVIEQEFVIKEYRGYSFNFFLGSPISWDENIDREWTKNQRISDFFAESRKLGSLTVPTQLQILKLNDNNLFDLVFDKSIESASAYSGGYWGRRWTIATVPLNLGSYKVIARTIQSNLIPEGLGVYLNISFHPKSTTIKENK